ncbi:hypothetical protein MPSEU_001041200 [Mayamaea pseudoterrestris]|nr:hypothetical protein MPSEU_001041200 [Mayamaea pseudoterrestris]
MTTRRRFILLYLTCFRAWTCQSFIVDVEVSKDRRCNAKKLAAEANGRDETPVRQLTSAATSMLVLTIPIVAAAVSGGGLDYANIDITGQDFSNGNYKGKDFTQVIAKATTFANSNLQGCRFYKAFLARTDFSGADLRGASLEDTSMDDAILKGAIASGAYFGASILDVATLENADFTDAQIPLKILVQLCNRDDATGTNPATGVDTRDSLMCP